MAYGVTEHCDQEAQRYCILVAPLSPSCSLPGHGFIASPASLDMSRGQVWLVVHTVAHGGLGLAGRARCPGVWRDRTGQK